VSQRAIRTSTVLAVVSAWLVVALAVGAAGLLRPLRPPGPQVLIFGLAGALVALGLSVPRIRAWVMSVDARLLVALHLTRFVGFYFLVLYGRGELPYDFAVPGGWGDIAVAAAAAVLLATARPTSRGGWLAYSVWNVAGFVDIMFVVLTAARLGLEDPTSLEALFRLPLALLPAWLVPLVIATHVLLAVRLARQRPVAPVRA
jgi:hypothetical protein